MACLTTYGANSPAVYTGAPLATPLTIGGPISVKFYLTDPAQPAWGAAQNPRLDIEIDAVDANGDLLLAVGAGEGEGCGANGVCKTGPQPTARTYTTAIPRRTPP